jgi:hypothetical protein
MPNTGETGEPDIEVTPAPCGVKAGWITVLPVPSDLGSRLVFKPCVVRRQCPRPDAMDNVRVLTVP